MRVGCCAGATYENPCKHEECHRVIIFMYANEKIAIDRALHIICIQRDDDISTQPRLTRRLPSIIIITTA